MPATHAPLILSHKRLHSRLSHLVDRAAAPTIRDAALEAARAMGPHGDPLEAAIALERSRERFENRLRPLWPRIIQSGVDFESDWLSSQGLMSGPRRTPGMLATVRNWVAERSALVWNRVSGWIIRKLVRVRGKALTRDRDVLPSMIESAEAMDFMARLVGLMEATYGLSTGGHYVRLEVGIGTKVWLSVIDRATRRPGRRGWYDHVSPHGQYQPQFLPFQVSGERLMFPGDAMLGASIGNLAGCRCLAVGVRSR